MRFLTLAGFFLLLVAGTMTKLAGPHARLVVHARSSLMGSIMSLELVRESQGSHFTAARRVCPTRYPLALVQGMERMEQAKLQSNFNCRAVWCMFLHAFAHRCSFFETFTI
ncbi:uncharacterized protein C8R40DRAFT_1104337 [Lentinula edodes]|uniref:uncharacterized protein n=1 Tax=Lentinula edodes TaxID=5353 RepID=UPI001E8CCF4D|nr:uncharacterized protein C8R40DRAFT_1104337 [Lentinula edodes]KAH7875475.1 hypothetical protein C8R40DRAFT_1104337 [Lentinula edodes]